MDGFSASVELAQGAFRLSVALSAAPGETLVLVGPSGSGKSTLLRVMAGLARPHQGLLRIAGQTVLDTERRVDLPPWRRRVGVVFQDFALFPHLTARANIQYGLRGGQVDRAPVEEWLELLGLTGLADRKPGQLSGGQQQRVALARAAVTDSDLLLLDEPFGSLDVTTRQNVRGELRRFLRRAAEGRGGRRRSTLLISHDYLDALTLGDRVAVLEEGRVTQVGTREEVLRRPRTPFLAALTGHNVLEGIAEPAGGGDLRAIRVGPLVLHAAIGPEIPAGPVFIAFGPEAVTLSPHRAVSSARNQFPAAVREMVPLADRLRVHLEAGAPLMADVVREAAAELRLEEGARVVAAIKSTAIEVYT
jgi:molybdate transport system ATP-binding protein